MALQTVREYVGPYMAQTLQFAFDSTAVAGALAVRDVDATVIVNLATMPRAGFVAWMSVDAVGGNFSAVTLLVQVAGSAVAASSWLVGDVASDYEAYLPSEVPFAAGETLAVEVDSLTTMRDCVITLGIVLANP